MSTACPPERDIAAPKGQHWQAGRYALHARFVSDLGAPVLELLDPRPGERVLDLGCGDGALTEEVRARGAGVVGVDQSADMVAATRARGIEAQLMDAQALSFDRAFDAVFSNAVLHWAPRLDAVALGVARALVPGGRFVGEQGGFGNIAAICTALIAVLERRGLDGAAALPWTYPTAERFAALLEGAGFTVETCALIPRPTPLATGMAGWLETFAGSVFAKLPEAEREAARDEAIALMRWSLRDEAGRWSADYVRLRFRAVLA